MIFLDTSFLVAYFFENDDFHERAVEVNERIKNEEKVISNLVISEVLTVLIGCAIINFSVDG
ncbi:PIN domain-containing protein [Methanobrevibacter filiformis]|uniref:PIN domain protein n=1 Tax=Methanobrevibacter filiformis TaxID=55758 RepID=A0A166F417_9EURY|nr:PIN domain-containing protein [Methanobrevibacter filiformis]KZX17290.1 PIN domain protein [Methanobrevibacter filiformis]